jgi:hypothetical protein
MNKITEYSLWEVLEQITSSLKSKRLAAVGCPLPEAAFVNDECASVI